jgi:hypothetical protein
MTAAAARTGISHPQRLLAVAAGLGEPFKANDLVVAAWRAYPAAFGMVGYQGEYPDRHSVLLYLMGKKGLVHRRCLRRVAAKTYRLTARGRREAEAAGRGEYREIRSSVHEPVGDALGRALDSAAYRRWLSDPGVPGPWAEVLGFYGLADGPGTPDVEGPSAALGRAVAAARECLRADGTVHLTGRRRQVRADELDRLERLDECLRFLVGRRRGPKVA